MTVQLKSDISNYYKNILSNECFDIPIIFTDDYYENFLEYFKKCPSGVPNCAGIFTGGHNPKLELNMIMKGNEYVHCCVNVDYNIIDPECLVKILINYPYQYTVLTKKLDIRFGYAFKYRPRATKYKQSKSFCYCNTEMYSFVDRLNNACKKLCEEMRMSKII